MTNSALETNASLLVQLRQRDDSIAWSKFVELYTPLIDCWIGQLGFKDPDRADLVQEVFVVLLGKVSNFQYDHSGSFRGWLRTITLNKCRDLLRRQNRKHEPQLLEKIELACQDDTDLLTQHEYRQYLSNAALKLMKRHFSLQTWQACWEHVAEGKPAKEVAEKLNISENAVYLARGRVLKRLREELDGLWD